MLAGLAAQAKKTATQGVVAQAKAKIEGSVAQRAEGAPVATTGEASTTQGAVAPPQGAAQETTAQETAATAATAAQATTATAAQETTATTATTAPSADKSTKFLVDDYKKQRTYRAYIEDKINKLTARLAELNTPAQPPEDNKKGKKSHTSVQASSEALTDMFVTDYMLIILLNQESLSKPLKINYTNQFETIKAMIATYQLIIANTEPPTDTMSGGDASPPLGQLIKADDSMKGDLAKGLTNGQSDSIVFEDSKLLLQALKAFHAYLYMSLEQNETLSTLLKNPFNALNNDAWSTILTSRENALLSSRESLSIQDGLFNKVYRAYDIAYKKFMIQNPQLEPEEKAELTETHTNSQNVKNNSKPKLNSELTPLQNAQAQIQELEALAATSPDPDILSKLPQESIKLAENAHKVKDQLFAEAAPEAVVLQKIQVALDKLIERPAAAPSAPSAPTALTAPSAPTAAPSAPAVESAAPATVEEDPTQTHIGGRRLRKSRRRIVNQKKKKTLRRSKR